MIAFNITLNAVLVLALGVLFLAGGVYFLSVPHLRILGVGMLALASGCVCCGLTDGFADVSPLGLMLRRFGFISFLVGIPVVGYSVYRYL